MSSPTKPMEEVVLESISWHHTGMATNSEVERFRSTVWRHYTKAARSFPWRETEDPYRILVSEFMLQQTQASRVVEKYQKFLEALPTLADLAAAPQVEVLRLWQGLGYNRRALNLQRTAQQIVAEQVGVVPIDPEQLDALPGIGPYTARAIVTFAYQQPQVFIETNIRRAVIHHFFPDREQVTDRELLPLVEKTLDHSNPRHWYYALMDYGAVLPRQVINPNRRSAHYTRQSSFSGSKRQLRGALLRTLLQRGRQPVEVLSQATDRPPEQVAACLQELATEGFLCYDEKTAWLAET